MKKNPFKIGEKLLPSKYSPFNGTILEHQEYKVKFIIDHETMMVQQNGGFIFKSITAYFNSAKSPIRIVEAISNKLLLMDEFDRLNIYLHYYINQTELAISGKYKINTSSFHDFKNVVNKNWHGGLEIIDYSVKFTKELKII